MESGQTAGMTKKSNKSAFVVPVQEPVAETGGKLTKAQLIEQVGAQASLTKVHSTGVVNTLLELLVEALTQGKTVSLPELGTFTVADTAARTGRNPSTGAPLDIPAGKKVAFKVAKALKSSL